MQLHQTAGGVVLVRVSVNLTAQDYRRGLQQAFPNNRRALRIRIALLALLGAAEAALLVPIAHTQHYPIANLVVIAVAGMAVALFGIARLTVGRVWQRRRLTGTPREMEISQDGVIIRTAGTETRVHWTEYTAARETEDFFLLYRWPRRAVMIPKAALDEIPAAALRDFLLGGEFARLSTARRRRAVRVAVVSPPQAPSTLPAPPPRPRG
jgi:hypothetical protein